MCSHTVAQGTKEHCNGVVWKKKLDFTKLLTLLHVLLCHENTHGYVLCDVVCSLYSFKGSGLKRKTCEYVQNVEAGLKLHGRRGKLSGGFSPPLTLFFSKRGISHTKNHMLKLTCRGAYYRYEWVQVKHGLCLVITWVWIQQPPRHEQVLWIQGYMI